MKLSQKTAVRPIASWPHLAGFLLIMAGLTAWGFHSQQAGIGKAGDAAAGQLAGHNEWLSFYLTSILGNCALLYYCWAGVHHYGGNLATLTGGRWTSWKAVFSDLAVALPFWVLWEAVAYGVARLMGPSEAKSASDLLPKSLLEILLWIAVSVTAGFCEEIQCRGYLQRQFHALSGNVVTAVLGQALVFGLIHSYQGWKRSAKKLQPRWPLGSSSSSPFLSSFLQEWAQQCGCRASMGCLRDR
jgi:membrane protease YdiL (CAAX protease family)